MNEVNDDIGVCHYDGDGLNRDQEALSFRQEDRLCLSVVNAGILEKALSHEPRHTNPLRKLEEFRLAYFFPTECF